MKNLSLLARIMFGVPIAFIGLGHFIQTNFFTMQFTSHINIGPYMMMISGIFLIAAGISIALNKFVVPATLALSVMIFIIIVSIHIPNYFKGNETEKAFAMFALLKDISLLGGSILVMDLEFLKSKSQ